MSRTSLSLSLAVIEVKYTPDTSGFVANNEGKLELPSNATSFFSRLAASNRDSLGYDLSMVPASEDEIKSLKESLPSFDNPEALIRDEKAIYNAFSDAVTHGTSSIWPIYKVTVTDSDGSQHNFLVSKPCTELPSLYGRGGKGYIAFDLGRKDFVFLKDSWRPDTDTITPEYAIYQALRDKGLTAKDYVATMRCGGDVPDRDGTGVQRTRSQKGLPKRKLARIHCRLVLNEIAHHMSAYGDSKGLISFVLCALYGMFL